MAKGNLSPERTLRDGATRNKWQHSSPNPNTVPSKGMHDLVRRQTGSAGNTFQNPISQAPCPSRRCLDPASFSAGELLEVWEETGKEINKNFVYCFLLMRVKCKQGRVVWVPSFIGQTGMELQQGYAWLSAQNVESVSKEESIKLCEERKHTKTLMYLRS